MSPGRVVMAGLRLVLSGVLLVLIFSQVPLESVINSMAGADIRLLLLGGFTFLAVHYVSAWKLSYLIRPQKIVASVAKLYGINLVAHFYGCVLPVGGAASSAVRWYKLATIDGQRAQAFAAIAVNRTIEFVAISAIGVGAWALDPHPGRLWIIGGIANFFLALFLVMYVVSFSATLLAGARRVIERLGGFLPGIAARLAKVAVALSQYPRLTLSERLRLLSLALLRNVLGVCAFYLLASAIDLHLSLLTLAWVRSAITLLAFVPLAFLGVGVREVTLMYLLGPYGVPDSAAVALGFLYLAANLAVAIVGGAVEVHGILGRSAVGRQKSPPS